MSIVTNNTSLEKWESYYQKNSFLVKLIEFVNERYFSKYFESVFKRVVGKKIQGLKILEPACGSGIMSARLTKQGSSSYLLDNSSNALKIVLNNFEKQQTKATGIIKGDISLMPFKNDSFDIVWNQGVIEHFKNREEVVEEMFRVLKRGGHLILFVPGYLSPLHIIYWILSILSLKKFWPFDEQDFLKKKELLHLLKKEGVKNIKVKRLIGSCLLSHVAYGERCI